ncbi:hypothetical protein MCC01998_16580 [Bifidobacteriaceae bacterium MCC01998]|nr:hypothetical protein MCC01994_14230 [Bifidobacteriaceae bacterium MCC01994]GDZ10590.1 hypothetical protein MCC01993_07030 [Bifidobacteriaceae bacterium MCC01993]GDZ62567.1 hypothetical protein MCC02037_12300 [Bifidobacteriaceae bacterium MCC02037]GDZ68363.1 hypothetical protein MCC01988_12300 [Bifidobacteriaceae bacterium MCC01988]GDZ74583.1 hypothetical protein MCC01998_16580 [Bifidobacteriaceae bacterium MCC01998]
MIWSVSVVLMGGEDGVFCLPCGSGGGEMFMLFLRECRKVLYRVYKQYNYKALRKMIAFLQ